MFDFDDFFEIAVKTLCIICLLAFTVFIVSNLVLYLTNLF